MFEKCYKLRELKIDKWDTSNVIYMRHIFEDCYSLFILDIDNWDVKNAIKTGFGNYTGIVGMFNGCKSLRNYPYWYSR
jgi:surface protein